MRSTLGTEDGDPQEDRIVGAVVAVHTLILLGIVAIFIPYALAGLCASFLLCLGFVALIAAERNTQAKAEDAAMRKAFLKENGYGKP